MRAEGNQIEKLSTRPGSADDAAKTASLARKLNAVWVVLDGYQFGAEYQREVRAMKNPLLVIDDNSHASHYYADLILNQNLHASQDMYTHREPYTNLLLGPRYGLLRREFARWRDWIRENHEVATQLLVTLGGAPGPGVVRTVIRSLRELEGVTRMIVVGDEHDAKDTFNGTGSRIVLQSNVTDMAEVMSHSDIAVSGGGSTCWELAFMGVPNIIIVLADNQESVARSLDEKGVAVNLGGYTSVNQAVLAQTVEKLMRDSATRGSMSEKGRRLVDGLGAERVTAILKEKTQ
jgi:spore coat polysaccharide biosynthesis predicted glycosyltransferase SpsG